MRYALTAVVVVLLAGCSSTAGLDPTGWTPSDARVAPIACDELLAEWTPNAADAPAACWTFEETDGLEESVTAFTDDLSDHLGAKPAGDSECTAISSIGRTLTCRVEWSDGESVVTLSAGITVKALQGAVDQGVEYSDPQQTILHELLVWGPKAGLVEQDAALGEAPAGW